MNESKIKCSLLPEQVKSGDFIKVFTETEAFEDLVSWAKFNKRQSKLINGVISNFRKNSMSLTSGKNELEGVEPE